MSTMFIKSRQVWTARHSQNYQKNADVLGAQPDKAAHTCLNYNEATHLSQL